MACLVAASAAAMMAGKSNATVYGATGTVSALNTTDLAYGGPNVNWFSLNGVTSLGLCKTWVNVMVALKDDSRGQQMYAMLLAAYMAQTTVTIYVDDSVLNPNGVCYAQQVFVGTVP